MNKMDSLNYEFIKECLDKDTYPILKESAYRYFSVLLPFVQVHGETHLLFERRSATLASQPNEICFPGGGIEGVETPVAAAIRETSEELAIDSANIKILSKMPILVTPFGTILHPFVGTLPFLPEKPNPAEVSELFTVPLQFFLDNEPEKNDISVTTSPNEDFPFHHIKNGDTYRWGKGTYSVFFYIYKDKIIWGMTAKLIYELVTKLRKLE